MESSVPLAAPTDSQRWRNGWCRPFRCPRWLAWDPHCRATPRRLSRSSPSWHRVGLLAWKPVSCESAFDVFSKANHRTMRSSVARVCGGSCCTALRWCPEPCWSPRRLVGWCCAPFSPLPPQICSRSVWIHAPPSRHTEQLQPVRQ